MVYCLKKCTGIYEVVTDSTNKKDEKWYINTNESFTLNNTVTRSWGTATAKAHADTLWTQTDSDNGFLPSDKDVGDVKTEGLKTVLIRDIKKQATTYITRNRLVYYKKSRKNNCYSIFNHNTETRLERKQLKWKQQLQMHQTPQL